MAVKPDGDFVMVSKSAVLQKYGEIKEASYRKGFQKGYFKAINDFQDLIDEKILSEVVFETLFLYWKEGLGIWKPSENIGRSEPPTLNEWLDENFEWLDEYFKRTQRKYNHGVKESKHKGRAIIDRSSG